MANRLTTTFTSSLVHAAGSASLSATETRTLAGTGFINIEQEIGNAWEAINVTDIGTLGFLFIRNEDAVDYVQIATANDDTGIFGKIAAGRGLPVDVASGATYYLKSSSGTVKVVILATEA